MSANGTRIRLVEARYDWITATAHAGPRGDNLEEFAREAIAAERVGGDALKSASVQGYSGEGTKHLFCGQRGDGVYVRASGSTADDLAPWLAKLADHWSRVDLCVTGQSAEPGYDPASEYWDLGQADDREHPRLPTISQARKRWGGITTYVGARSSAVHARTYDKHAESKGHYEPGTWRWELELKQFASEEEQSRALEQPRRFDDFRDVVAHQFTRWGLPIPFNEGAIVELWRAPKRQTDVDLKERWLRSYVAKSAQLVERVYGRDRVLAALGLENDDSVTGA